MSECLGSDYKEFDGSDLSKRFASNSACAVLNSGAVVCMTPAMYLFVDVNGKDGPDIAGRDYFAMRVSNSGDISGLCDQDQAADYDASIRTAFPKIVRAGWQMDY